MLPHDVSAPAAQTESRQDNHFSYVVPLDVSCAKLYWIIMIICIYVADEMMSIRGQGELFVFLAFYYYFYSCLFSTFYMLQLCLG